MKKFKRYSTDEINNIKELSKTRTISEISEITERSTDSLYELFKKLNITKLPSACWWTDEDIEFLLKNYENSTSDYLVKSLNKKWKSISKKARSLGLNRFRKNGEKVVSASLLSDTEKEFILSNYNTMTVSQMGKYLGRSDICITLFCRNNNLNVFRFRKIIKDYSEEFLLNSLLEMSKDLARCPTKEDVMKNKNLPSVDTYYDRFGSFVNACELIGLIPNSGKYGQICYSINGDRCLSTREQDITNFLIKRKISYIKEKPYSDLIFGLNRRVIMDWYLCELNIVVEFFGLDNEKYNEKTKYKIKLCKKNNIKIIPIFEKDINKLEKIFNIYINNYP